MQAMPQVLNQGDMVPHGMSSERVCLPGSHRHAASCWHSSNKPACWHSLARVKCLDSQIQHSSWRALLT
jgi:hypothetical protein